MMCAPETCMGRVPDWAGDMPGEPCERSCPEPAAASAAATAHQIHYSLNQQTSSQTVVLQYASNTPGQHPQAVMISVRASSKSGHEGISAPVGAMGSGKLRRDLKSC